MYGPIDSPIRERNNVFVKYRKMIENSSNVLFRPRTKYKDSLIYFDIQNILKKCVHQFQFNGNLINKWI